MSKGYGHVQRAIIEAVDASGLDKDGIPKHVNSTSLAWHVYKTFYPTPAQRESVRRAIHKLEDAGEVERVWWGSKPMRIRKPLTVEQHAAEEAREALRSAQMAQRIAELMRPT